MFHKPRTLLWQLGLALMATQAVAAVILGWYATATFRQFTNQQTIAELNRVTPLLVQRYVDPLSQEEQSRDAAALDRLVKDDGRRTGLRITVILPDGQVIADSAADPASLENHLQRPEVQDALHGHTSSANRHSASTNLDTMYLAQLLNVDGKPRAVVRTALPLSIANAAPNQMIRVVGTAAAISVALTFLIIYFVSRKLSQTISRLSDGAAQFAQGRLTHRIKKPASHELAALSDALNHMAEQLNEQIDLLRAQRSEQQAIQQSMSNGLLALDLNQRLISVNRAAERLLGLDGSTARGRLLQELVREPELNRFVSEIMAGGGRPLAESEFQLRGRGQGRAGGGAMIQAISEPLRNARDQPVGLLIFINDVTQLRRLESIRSDFAANVSHELRTPITNIKGYVETMIEVGVDDRAQTQKFLEIINRNTVRLASIIEDLLALARLEQPDAKTSLERVSVKAHRVVEAASAQFESELAAKGTVIRNEISADITVSANPQLLEQAIGNLLSNAIKYSPGGTTVTVSAKAMETGEVQIAVADQGPGIPSEHLSRIFERFYRVDRARSREMGGTGLGLSIVKHIALVHGGKVEVESEVGRGSVFRIIIPRG